MSGNNGDGPDEQERDQPGDTGTNPAGKSSDKPAEGADDTPPGQPGSPAG
jgi:hypothetical protein